MSRIRDYSLDDAFKALELVDAEESKELKEAINRPTKFLKDVRRINESSSEEKDDKFSIYSQEDMKKAKKSLNTKKVIKEPIESVVDTNAKSIDDLKTSYVGKVILQCPTCKTLIYKDKEDITQDEASKLYNVGEQCPNCKIDTGWLLSGQVAPLPTDADGEVPNVKDLPKEDEERPETFDIPKLASEDDNQNEDETKGQDEDSVIDNIVQDEDEENKVREPLNKPLKEDYDDIEGFEPDDRCVYLFAAEDITDEDLDAARAYGLEPLGINIFERSDYTEYNLVMRGTYEDLKDYCDDYLGYEMHPDYLYHEEDFGGNIDIPLNSDGSIDVNIADVDENLFEGLINKFLKEVYENVDKFKLTEGSIDDEHGTIKLEGTILFKSGKSKNTTFLFENAGMSKNGKIRFNGLNETFSKSNKAFRLTTSLKEGKLLSESLIYEFGADAKKIYGRVKN